MKFSAFTLAMVVVLVLAYLLREYYYQPKFIQGEKTPGIEGKLLNGEQFSLDDLMGKYVLLDFWGSWCGPCRRENKDLVPFYHKFNSAKFSNAEGFEIVSIGVERDSVRWVNAINKDKLSWKYHISDFKRFKSPMVMEYGVKEIPTKYLLNPKGKIVGVNLSIKAMDKLLSGKLVNAI